MKFRLLSANGAILYQLGATPRDRHTAPHRGLKARASFRAGGSGLQPSGVRERLTLGGAQGCYEAVALPLGEAASGAIEAESAEVLRAVRERL